MHYTTLAQLLTTQIGWAWNAFPYSQLNLAVCGRQGAKNTGKFN